MSYITTANGKQFINDKHLAKSLPKSTRITSPIQPFIQKPKPLDSIPSQELAPVIDYGFKGAGSEIINKLKQMEMTDKNLKSIINSSKYHKITTKGSGLNIL